MCKKAKETQTAGAPFNHMFGDVFNDIFSKATTAKNSSKCNSCDDSECAPVYPDYGMEYLNTIIDLKPVLVRIAVMAAHCHDLIHAHTPEATRALTMLNEIDLLTKDGMTRIQQTVEDL